VRDAAPGRITAKKGDFGMKRLFSTLRAARSEEGHAYAWSGGGLITIALVVLLLILIF
jgi:hypothetical protein